MCFGQSFIWYKEICFPTLSTIFKTAPPGLWICERSRRRRRTSSTWTRSTMSALLPVLQVHLRPAHCTSANPTWVLKSCQIEKKRPKNYVLANLSDLMWGFRISRPKTLRPFFSLFLVRKPLSSDQKWFLRSYVPLIMGMFLLKKWS